MDLVGWNFAPFSTSYFKLFSSASALCLYQSSYISFNKVMKRIKLSGPALAGYPFDVVISGIVCRKQIIFIIIEI